jgi:hypothetical protein
MVLVGIERVIEMRLNLGKFDLVISQKQKYRCFEEQIAMLVRCNRDLGQQGT